MERTASISEFLEESGYVPVELRPTPVGHLELDAVVNGHQARMLVDTGASATVIDRAAADRWNVARQVVEGEALGCVTFGSVESATLDQLKLSDLEMKDVAVTVLDLTPINAGLEHKKAEPIDGIIGSDLMVKRDAVIEYASSILHLRR